MTINAENSKEEKDDYDRLNCDFVLCYSCNNSRLTNGSVRPVRKHADNNEQRLWKDTVVIGKKVL